MKQVIIGLAAAAFAQSALAAPLPPEAASQAKDAVELFYIQREIYSPVRCTAKEAEQTFIFCHHPLNRDSGGLYTADLSEDGKLRVWAVNGKAKQHIGKGGATMVKDDDTPVPAKPWAGDLFDIPGTLDLFR